MNKRQAWKQQEKENERGLAQNIMIYCPNWKMCCAEPAEECFECRTYYYLKAQQTFRKMLKREGFSVSGWKFAECPAKGVYIFYNHKKHKEITLETDDNVNYSITVYDFHSLRNIEYPTIKEALRSPLHTYFYAPGVHKSLFRKEEEKRLRNIYLEEK